VDRIPRGRDNQNDRGQRYVHAVRPTLVSRTATEQNRTALVGTPVRLTPSEFHRVAVLNPPYRIVSDRIVIFGVRKLRVPGLSYMALFA